MMFVVPALAGRPRYYNLRPKVFVTDSVFRSAATLPLAGAEVHRRGGTFSTQGETIGTIVLRNEIADCFVGVMSGQAGRARLILRDIEA